MRKVLLGILGLVFLASTIWLGYYFYNKSHTDPVVYKTERPFYTDIVKKTVATGSIVPRREVEIKSQVSGIIEALYVEPGETVKLGQLIAKIRIVPNLVQVNQARTNLETVRINFNNAQRELERQQQLFVQRVIAEQEYNRFKLDFQLQKEALQAAENNLQLVQEGASKRTGQVSNIVYATVDGMLLDVPVKVGGSVIERNNFNEGTTIATIADMKSLFLRARSTSRKWARSAKTWI
jgi:HlyD family secretion protein